MRKQIALFLGFCIFTAIACTSCSSVRVKHGKDCGCGSFGQVELKQGRPQ